MVACEQHLDCKQRQKSSGCIRIVSSRHATAEGRWLLVNSLHEWRSAAPQVKVYRHNGCWE